MMRSLALLALTLLLGMTTARADSLADLHRPSSTIPGCVNDWGPLGTGAGVAEPTCEAKAALAEWNGHTAAISAARDRLVQASRLPDRADPQMIVNALNACAAAADAMARLDHPAPLAPHEYADVLAWMRPWFKKHKQPIPAAIGDGFRTLAAALAKPGLLRQDRIVIYDQAAVFAIREGELAAELGNEVERQTDDAVRAAHIAALKAAQAVENGRSPSKAAKAITAAAGPGHAAVAQQQTVQLEHSLAAHPDQGSNTMRTGRAIAAIPSALLWIGSIALLGIVVGSPRLVARLGIAAAVEFSLLVLIALPLGWLPLALLHALTGWPGAGWLGFVLWLALFGTLLAAGPRLLPGRLERVWGALFAPAPLSTPRHRPFRRGARRRRCRPSDAAGTR